MRNTLRVSTLTTEQISVTILSSTGKKMLEKSFEKAKQMLSENREALDKISEYLIEKETITGKEFMKLFTEITGIVDEKKNRINEIEVEK